MGILALLFILLTVYTKQVGSKAALLCWSRRMCFMHFCCVRAHAHNPAAPARSLADASHTERRTASRRSGVQDGGPGPQQQRSLLLTAATPCSSRQPGHAGQQAPEAYTDIPAEGADGGEEAKLLDDSPALDAAAASLLAGPGLRVFGNGAGSGSSRGSGVGGSGGGKGHDPSLVGLEPPGSGHDGCRGLHSPAQLQLSIPAGWEAPVSAAGHSSSQQGWWGGAAGCHSWLQARLGWLEARMAESVGGDTPLPGSEQGTAARGAAGHGGCGAGLAPGR